MKMYIKIICFVSCYVLSLTASKPSEYDDPTLRYLSGLGIDIAGSGGTTNVQTNVVNNLHYIDRSEHNTYRLTGTSTPTRDKPKSKPKPNKNDNRNPNNPNFNDYGSGYPNNPNYNTGYVNNPNYDTGYLNDPYNPGYANGPVNDPNYKRPVNDPNYNRPVNDPYYNGGANPNYGPGEHPELVVTGNTHHKNNFEAHLSTYSSTNRKYDSTKKH